MSASPCSHFGEIRRFLKISGSNGCSQAEIGWTILKASPRTCKPPEQGLEMGKSNTVTFYSKR
jgi:hypothetical protein